MKCHWLNVLPIVNDNLKRSGKKLPVPSVMRNGTIAPISFEKLAGITTNEAAKIELMMEQYETETSIKIPDLVLAEYKNYRPTPFYRAEEFERLIATINGKKELEFARIFIKDESKNPPNGLGSHKANTALAQAFYAKIDGKTAVVTDTGAGQWGMAVSYAAKFFGLGSTVFMTRNSFDAKKGRVGIMEEYAGKVYSSPSQITEIGRTEASKDANHPGSLGIGMSEAVSLVNDNSSLLLGCMSYYAALHQSIIGLEVREQLAKNSVSPDVLVACVGGGSNFCGLVAPYIEEKLSGKGPIFVAAESVNIPVLTKGEYRWDHQDYGELMPILLMYTLGHENIAPKLHAGGLRYHGKNPLLSLLYQRKLVEAVALDQDDVLRSGLDFQRAEGILPAPESAHAILAGMQKAIEAENQKRKSNIIILLTGNGTFDNLAYESISF